MDADAAAANAENGGEPAMPQYFGSYEVLKTIGKGKFAVVYRAKKIGDDQVVALKRIAVDMMNDKAREKCLKEVRLLQSLDHPNIVRYMDSFICENDLMIVYEWAAAGDLKRQLRKAQERGTGFEERVIWKYFSQICNAMQHMHERRIMHRDLKPANIFLTLDGTIKVGDLGLSRELSEHTIQAHSKVGTPLYMSPEVLKGEGYDFKSDIWSLGCLLYELAMLKSPFKSEGLNLYSLFQKISHGDFTPLPENFSEELRNLAYSMISTKSEDRPEIGDVCKIAQEMRTLTADKAARKKSARADNANSAKSRGATPVEASTKLEPSVRPVMGVADSKPEARRQDQGQGQKQELGIARADAPRGNSRDSRDSRESSRAGERGSGRGRGSREDVKSGVQWDFAKEDEKTDMPPRSAGSRGSRGGQEQGGRPNLQRDSSFKLEPVNDETAPRDPFMGDTGRLFFAGSDAPDSEDETDDNDDDATVKLGLADQGQDTPPGVVALGSDRDPLPGNHGNSGNRYQAGAPAGREGGIGGSGGGGRYSGGNENGRSGSGGKSRSPTHSGINGAAPVASAERAVGGGAAVTSTSASGTVSYRRHKAPASKPPMQAQAQSHGRQRSPGESKGDVDLGDTGGMGGTGMLPNSESAYRVNGKKLGEHLQHSAPAFALMEVLYDKLNALGYPLEDPYVKEQSRQQASRGRLLPIHFACDLHLFPTVAGHSKGYQFMQFRRMANVAAWLCGRIRGTPADLAAQLNLEQDAPMTTAKQLLRAAQAVQGPLSAELGQISPTSLTPGFGLNVCTLLMHLADAALGVVQVPTTLLYRDQAPDEEADVGLDVEDEVRLTILYAVHCTLH
ncbi:kinase-like domain-containing protein [Ochromonadaceae sp. CCMP2298]|nr:kinase-like domain-containing protein [Ochromonadaceae sp. CCMP2298]